MGPGSGPSPAGGLPQGALGYLGAALVCALAFVLTCRVFLWTPRGQQLDGLLLPPAERGGGYEQQSVLTDPAKTLLAFFGDYTVLAILVASVLLVGVLSRRLYAGVAGVFMVLCAVGVAGLAKSAIPRPELGVVGSTTHNSFPSGHVTAAMALLLAFMLVLPARARLWFALPGVAGVSAVASATMIAGWHRFSDVIGGVLLAEVLFFLAAAALTVRRAVPGTGIRLSGGLAGVLGSMVLVAGLLLLVPQPVPSDGSGSAPVAGSGPFVAIAAGTGFTVFAVVSALSLVWSVDFRPPRFGPPRVSPGGPGPKNPDINAYRNHFKHMVGNAETATFGPWCDSWRHVPSALDRRSPDRA
ncbi:membrane-associated phospholipid phosphatase [Micromonospora pisi]|uniref:Membrane-associated phospholipid phosphatase n=1 Tax=Micromonospora pisi TaxID=589240 RepID=A0A495JSV2_9ACTN|nr:phosphatase PAP2 family protein [Micromonospora pisi]RKR91608.1 membrane-associated phospholipid phosphatase [Micromonospora pisi]